MKRFSLRVSLMSFLRLPRTMLIDSTIRSTNIAVRSCTFCSCNIEHVGRRAKSSGKRRNRGNREPATKGGLFRSISGYYTAYRICLVVHVGGRTTHVPVCHEFRSQWGRSALHALRAGSRNRDNAKRGSPIDCPLIVASYGLGVLMHRQLIQHALRMIHLIQNEQDIP
jgi:hypothetical protein